MKSISEMIKETGLDEVIFFNKFSIDEEEKLKRAFKVYGDMIVDEIMQDLSMIYYDGAEAIYSYEAFEKFKKEQIR